MALSRACLGVARTLAGAYGVTERFQTESAPALEVKGLLGRSADGRGRNIGLYTTTVGEGACEWCACFIEEVLVCKIKKSR